MAAFSTCTIEQSEIAVAVAMRNGRLARPTSEKRVDRSPAGEVPAQTSSHWS
jgi:hypothetical protein